MTLLHSVDDLTTTILAAAHGRPGHRLIVGIVGPPGAGKSTIAEAVVARLNGEAGEARLNGEARPNAAAWPNAALLPMDGFHLPQARLVELGRRDRMGAPDTFDVDGFLATLTALRTPGPSVPRSAPADASTSSAAPAPAPTPPATVLAPGFDRTIEEAVPDAITIHPEHSIVVVEGNYLLLDAHGWSAVRPLIDVTVFVRLQRGIRLTRLIDRHVRFGKSPEAAEAWALGPDETNAVLIDGTADRADHVIEL